MTLRVDGTERSYVEFYDAETGLLAGRIEKLNTQLGPAEMTGVTSGYRQFGDLKIATRWQHELGAQKWSAEYTSFEINEVDAAVFDLPPEIRELQPSGN